MTQKRYTLIEKIEICEKAIQAEKEGISLFKSSKNIGVSDVSLYRWVRDFRAGILRGKETQEQYIPPSLIEVITEELNGTESEEIEMIPVMVFSGSPENNITLNVEKPNTNNVDEYNDAMDILVFKELQWCFVMKGFKF